MLENTRVKGRKHLGDSFVVVCGVVRDAATGLRKNIPVIQWFCSQCRDFRVVVFENDSKDKTKELLQAWQATDSNRISVFCEDRQCGSTTPTAKEVSCNPAFSNYRIGRMAKLRNQYMEYIWKQNWDADYLVVVDLDVCRMGLEGIISSFETEQEWDAVTAFGYSNASPRLKPRYYDTYALTPWGKETVPQTAEQIISRAYELGKIKPVDPWVRIFSAFGGLAIYRYEAVKGLLYEVIKNDDPTVEVRCEHFSLHKQMTERGYTHFYINPRMRIQYQKITWKVLFKAFKRRILGIK